jgi:hypothetical protein
LFGIASLAIVAGLIVAAFFTRDAWEPTMLSYLGQGTESPTPPPAAPKPVAPVVTCPAGTQRKGDACIKLIDTRCPAGMRFTSRGCVAIVASEDSKPDAAATSPVARKPGGPATQSGDLSTNSQLWVKCQPECENVRIDNKSFGPSPARAVLPPGTHTVVGQRNGYSAPTTSVVTRVRTTHTVTLRLSPNAGSPGANTAKTCDCAKKTQDVGCATFCALQKK